MKIIANTPYTAILKGMASKVSITTSDFLEWKDKDKDQLVTFLTSRNIDKILKSKDTFEILYIYLTAFQGLFTFFKTSIGLRVNLEMEQIDVYSDGILIYCISKADLIFTNFTLICFDIFAIGGSIITVIDKMGLSENPNRTLQTCFVA